MRKMADAGINIICGPTGSSQSLSALAVGRTQNIVQAVYANASGRRRRGRNIRNQLPVLL